MDIERLRALIAEHEGRRATAYKDSRGIPTVGVGFNLTRPDARQKISALGVNYDLLCQTTVTLTDAQIDTLLDADIAGALADARVCVGNFDALPEPAQMVVVDMIFNLGAAGFSKFKKMIGALEQGNLEQASKEMQDSAWYAQVKERGVADVALMRSGVATA